jgi:hypothetical protein
MNEQSGLKPMLLLSDIQLKAAPIQQTLQSWIFKTLAWEEPELNLRTSSVQALHLNSAKVILRIC